MKKIITLLAVLGLALTLTAAEPAAPKFVDGNWFTASGAVDSGLQAQIDQYEAAKEASEAANATDEKALADCEQFAIRSWVKGMYALQLGLVSLNRGDYEAARGHYKRALSYAKTAQKPGAGRGEKTEGMSVEQGKVVAEIAKTQLAKISDKIGSEQ